MNANKVTYLLHSCKFGALIARLRNASRYFISTGPCLRIQELLSVLLFQFDREYRSCSALREFHQLALNPKVHYTVHKNPPLILILRRLSSFHICIFYSFEIHFNIIILLFACRFWKGTITKEFPKVKGKVIPITGRVWPRGWVEV